MLSPTASPVPGNDLLLLNRGGLSVKKLELGNLNNHTTDCGLIDEISDAVWSEVWSKLTKKFGSNSVLVSFDPWLDLSRDRKPQNRKFKFQVFDAFWMELRCKSMVWGSNWVKIKSDSATNSEYDSHYFEFFKTLVVRDSTQVTISTNRVSMTQSRNSPRDSLDCPHIAFSGNISQNRWNTHAPFDTWFKALSTLRQRLFQKHL